MQRTETHRSFGPKPWYAFEYITRVPISTHLVDWTLLTRAEKAWLQEYNARVKREVMPLICDDKRAVRWLKRQ